MSDIIDFTGVETMTPEQKTEWFKKAADDYAGKSGYKKPEDIAGLVNKNHEVISEKKKLQARLRELESDPGLNKSKTIADLLEQGGIFSPDDDIETIKQKLQKAVPSDKYSELEVKLRRMEKQLSEKDTAEKALSAQVEAERAKRYNAEKERKILSAMSAANITDESKDMVLNFFSSKTKVSETDGKLNIFYEDEEGLNPTVDSYIQSWAKTDKAKPFIKAPVSSGAGITGSNGTGGGKMTAEQIVAMYPGDQNRGLRAKMYKEHGVIA